MQQYATGPYNHHKDVIIYALDRTFSVSVLFYGLIKRWPDVTILTTAQVTREILLHIHKLLATTPKKVLQYTPKYRVIIIFLT